MATHRLRSVSLAAIALLYSSSPLVAQTQADMNEEASKSYADADKKLTETYQDLLKNLGPENQDRLRQAQRSWINFRDDECRFRTADSAGGSVHPMMVSGCLADLTHQRLNQLKALSDCEEGDLSCMVPRRN